MQLVGKALVGPAHDDAGVRHEGSQPVDFHLKASGEWAGEAGAVPADVQRDGLQEVEEGFVGCLDLDDSRDLIAVSAASNRSEGDKDPSDWMPPYAGYGCQYLTYWVADKTRWGLSVDPTEQATLTAGLSRCPDQPIHVTLAR